jgi:hypothetical protein
VDTVTIILGGFTLGFAVAAIAALLMLHEADGKIAALQLAAATARADAEHNRADVAEQQLSAAQRAQKAAEDDEDRQIEDALRTGKTIDPTSTWDVRSDASGPVRVLSPTGPGAGAGRDAAPVPDRGPVGDAGRAVAGAAAVPGKPAGR